MALLSGWRGPSPIRRLRRRGALRLDMDSSKPAAQLVVLATWSALDPLRRPTRWTPARSSPLEALQRPQTTTAGSGAKDRPQRQRALLRHLAAWTVLQRSWAYPQRRDLRTAQALLRNSGEADWAAFAKQRKGVFEVVRSRRWVGSASGGLYGRRQGQDQPREGLSGGACMNKRCKLASET